MGSNGWEGISGWCAHRGAIVSANRIGWAKVLSEVLGVHLLFPFKW